MSMLLPFVPVITALAFWGFYCLCRHWSFGAFIGLFLVSYIPIALLVGAYNSHHYCNWDTKYLGSGGDKTLCSVFTGAIWPLWVSSRTAVWITDPQLYSEIRFPVPSLKWE